MDDRFNRIFTATAIAVALIAVFLAWPLIHGLIAAAQAALTLGSVAAG